MISGDLIILEEGSDGAGVDRLGAEHTAQIIHHRLTATIRSDQGSLIILYLVRLD